MRYEIILSPEAMEDLGNLKANIRACSGTQLKSTYAISRKRSAEAALNACGDYLARNIGCASGILESFTM
jgi:hypothetical protein